MAARTMPGEHPAEHPEAQPVSAHPAPADIRTITVVGAGAIGASWAVFVLAQGRDIVVTDPAPDARSRLEAALTPRLGEVGSSLAEVGDRLRFTDDLAEAAGAADLVLECGPERLEIKREIFAVLDAAARSEVLLTSSSSGLLPSSFQTACAAYPERVLVAHPFNPPHLVPLVEVVGGKATSEAAIEAALATFAALGKRPIRIDQELPGHVANRLQAALWREAYDIVARGAATVQDVDTAIASGPGLRWALLGPFATQHLSGGPGGLEHVLEHLGPPMVQWWNDLRQPELDEALRARLVAGVEEELVGTDLADLTARRDRALRALLRLKADGDLD